MDSTVVAEFLSIVGPAIESQFLFVIGVEKSGTTSLFRAMQSLPQFNLTRKKESGFFRSQYERGIAHFESLFRDSFKGTAYNTDITPLYHRFPKVMHRLQQFKATKKILIMLRNPVKRAFSHYTHDIINHVSTGERSKDFSDTRVFSFLDLWEAKRLYFLRYEPIIRDAFERFGRQNCHVLFFEDMVRDWLLEASRLDEFFGFSDPVLASVELPHENRIENVPFIFAFDKQRDGNFWLAQKTRREVILRDGLADFQVRNAILAQGSFTLSVPASVVTEMTQWFESDIRALEDLLEVDLRAWRESFELSHAFASVEHEDLDMVRQYASEHGREVSFARYALREI